ncbi:MAG: hypothetical protein GY771_06710 [bacterium]|nr:hypothetical protein [bacterium]
MRHSRILISTFCVLTAISSLAYGGQEDVNDGAEPELLERQNRAVMKVDKVEVPLSVVANLTFIDVSVNGAEPLPFILDTGAGGSGINSSVYGDAEFETIGDIDVKGAGGEFDAEIVKPETISVGGAIMNEPELMIYDFGCMFDALGITVGGILGYDFISSFVVELNYDTLTATFHNPYKFVAPTNIEYLPVRFKMNLPLIDLSLDGVKGEFVFDLGNGSSAILSEWYVKENDLIENAPAKVDVIMRGMGGDGNKPVRSYYVRMGNISIGSNSIDDPIVILAGEGASACEGDEMGNVGSGIISRFVVFLDYDNQRIGFIPGDRFDAPFGYNRTGINAIPKGEYYLVESVTPGSSVEGKIKSGDRIIKIDGEDVAGFPYPRWMELREGSVGSTFNVTVIDDNGAEKEYEIELAELL